MASLVLDRVEHRFGRHRVLDGLSLRLEAGDCYGLLGPNGAGKTTAMRIALGFLRPDRGRVIVDGFDARTHAREAAARVSGQVEEARLYPGVSGVGNLTALARLQGIPRPSEAARAAFQRVGLEFAGRRPFRTYSQGMRGRLGIAQALLGSPGVILLDEPFSGLDPEAVAGDRVSPR
ncbi:MAG: ABC transporter ATP-binding protein, partial [Cyanothece sp. SIO1E1]|nr:ABC transporter ATP-binding protein [Cyanothece sp. SIO1E1]